MGALARRFALIGLLAAAGCRDGTAPEPPADREAVPPGAAAWQLTHSLFDDRSPGWAAGGDSVIYVAERYDLAPDNVGLVLSLPASAGAAVPLLPVAQAATGPRLAAPAISPDGGRLAYAELAGVRARRMFPGMSAVCDDGDRNPTVPQLRRAVIGVRAIAEQRPLPEDPRHQVEFEGFEYVPFGAVIGDMSLDLYITHHHPFHVLFDQEGASIFRPTWSPDGQTVAFSDGLRLYTWRPGGGPRTAVPRTADHVEAAWSPDGAWLAATHLVRGEETIDRCIYSTLGPTIVQERHRYPIIARTLVLVRPDGSERRELGPGEEPAWSPDGSRLYVRRGGGIWRVNVDGGGAEPVPDTQDCREPAASPDGRLLSCARRTGERNHDVWVVSLAR